MKSKKTLVKLGDYKGIKLSSSEVNKASQNALAAPENMYDETRRYLLQNIFINHLVDASQITVPEDMARKRAESIMQAFDQQLANNGYCLEDYYKECNTNEKELFDDFTGEARKQLSMRLTLRELATALSLEATDAEYRKEIEKLSLMSMLPEEKLLSIMQAEEEAEIRSDIAIAKAAEYIGRIIDEKYPA